MDIVSILRTFTYSSFWGWPRQWNTKANKKSWKQYSKPSNQQFNQGTSMDAGGDSEVKDKETIKDMYSLLNGIDIGIHDLDSVDCRR